MSSRPRPAPDSPEVPVSEELFAPLPSGIELCYQTFGDRDGQPLLLVMGLGGPMNWWDAELCKMLAARGFFVIRYDNRDTGRSSRIGVRVKRSALVRAFAGGRVRAPYSMADLAADGFGLLDHLGLESAHVVGVSMGGMIVQTMAIEQPRRVRSLTSIMSTTGKRTVGWQHPSLLAPMLASRGPGREAYVRSSATMWRLIGSPGYPQPREEVEDRARETFDRGVSASGVMRQMLAVLTQPNRSHRLRGAADAGAGHPRDGRQDGARLRRPGDLGRDPPRRAAAHRRDGPRPAARAVRDLHRGDRQDGRTREMTLTRPYLRAGQ